MVRAMVRLLATDVDGTLLNTSHQISGRTRAAFEAARAAGIEVMAVSGRQPYSIGAIVRDTALFGDAIGSNGAVAMNLLSRDVLFEELIELADQRAIADAMLARFPGLRLVSVRAAGNDYIAEDGYVGLHDPEAHHAMWQIRQWVGAREEVLAARSLKLVLRDNSVPPEALLAAARELAVPGTHATTWGRRSLRWAAPGSPRRALWNATAPRAASTAVKWWPSATTSTTSRCCGGPGSGSRWPTASRRPVQQPTT